MNAQIIFLICIMCGCCFTYGNSNIETATNSDTDISFYQTNLICSAAIDIGCGTRAKPVLIQFEHSAHVKEAWLNHAGTVIAVLWQENSELEKEKLADKIFANNNLAYNELSEQVYNENLAEFKTGKWYRGTDVDELSKIEAGRIADQIITVLQMKTELSDDNSLNMRKDLESYFRDELLSIEDASVIYSNSYWKEWERQIAKIGERYLGQGNFPELNICGSNASESCNSNKSSCCEKGSSKS